MSHEPQAAPPAGPGGGSYEQSDLSVKAIAVFGAVLTAVLILALVSMGWLFGFFSAWETRRDAPPSPMAGARSVPPEPRLQVNPPQDLKNLRAAEEARLSGYGWVSVEDGLARIPIDRAMQLLVERGLPKPVTVAPAMPARGGKR